MASTRLESHVDDHKQVDHPVPKADPESGETVDYGARANWLRAAVLGANDGIVTVASLMIGVGAVSTTSKVMVISGLAGLVAGAFSMAIGEFISVYAQYDIQKAQLSREIASGEKQPDSEETDDLPSPAQAAVASALAFTAGGIVPLLGGGFVRPWGARVGVVCGLTSLGLLGFGAAGGYLGGSSLRKSAVRVLIGGWIAMLVTYGVLKLFGVLFHMEVSAA